MLGANKWLYGIDGLSANLANCANDFYQAIVCIYFKWRDYMSMESEIRMRFGGFWNSLILLFVIIICLRFSGLEFADEPLIKRIFCALHLFLGCIAAGVLLGILKIFLAFSNQTYTRAPASANFVRGLKYGIVAGGLLILIVGILQLPGFLGVFQPMIDGLLAKFTAVFV